MTLKKNIKQKNNLMTMCCYIDPNLGTLKDNILAHSRLASAFDLKCGKTINVKLLSHTSIDSDFLLHYYYFSILWLHITRSNITKYGKTNLKDKFIGKLCLEKLKYLGSYHFKEITLYDCLINFLNKTFWLLIFFLYLYCSSTLECSQYKILK